MKKRPAEPERSSEFLDALRKGVLIGAGALVLVVPLHMAQQHRAERAVAPNPRVATAPQTQQPSGGQVPSQAQVATAPVAPDAPTAPGVHAAPPMPGVRLADFGSARPSADAKLVANWAVHTRDNGSRNIVLIDKKQATVYVLDPQGRLQGQTPALLGEWVGDDSTPGVGDKPLEQLKPWEKTTPAGRFIAEMGMNSHHEDVVWIDYNLALSMHRIIKGLPKEHRAARMASATIKDNRISNGCVNLPKPFYENVLAPAVRASGAVIYVLPDKKPLDKVFAVWDVTSPMQVAQRSVDKAPG